MDFKLINISKAPQLLESASSWFSRKWDISSKEYKKSMEESMELKACVPRWYIVLNKSNKIIAGAGIIENDFHYRKDLAPNLCALYVEEEYRNRGIARNILDYAKKDLGKEGIEKIYLVTDHIGLYEKFGWEFLTMVKDNHDNYMRMYMTDTSLERSSI